MKLPPNASELLTASQIADLTPQRQLECEMLQIKVDNGPENSGVRTQFLNRMVSFASAIAKPIQLLYYPP
ncbi:hypothetical protein G7B40_035115 [Aetokthonos hydrillicola Thurmond2011]|uniref:Uncharacterized protein n=1 Tax=Aetokthonos hydrillicola Thurmond2011 TaxID=2712845 RepID=A0AAP5M917_9CYAN|nr:hypothetical protein [Aetokthonos hydrillicola]MBW4590421.1 hypothetical protein [Aetokthonos hydrillicola CCALA 1050]MDR9899751.1 hypothetical protein [Aetokthonos hydrillicola Thurmond2011]